MEGGSGSVATDIEGGAAGVESLGEAGLGDWASGKGGD